MGQVGIIYTGDRYSGNKKNRKRFLVSTQHYFFAVKVFIELSNKFAMNEFELSIKQTTTNIGSILCNRVLRLNNIK